MGRRWKGELLMILERMEMSSIEGRTIHNRLSWRFINISLLTNKEHAVNKIKTSMSFRGVQIYYSRAARRCQLQRWRVQITRIKVVADIGIDTVKELFG